MPRAKIAWGTVVYTALHRGFVMRSHLQVTISGDGLAAVVVGTSGEISFCQAESEIRTALAQSGVIDGFLDDAIAGAAKQLSSTGGMGPVVLAQGRAPHPGLLPGAHFDVTVYELSALAPGALSPGGILHAMLCETIPDPVIVQTGERVGRFVRGEPPSVGFTVSGKSLPIPPRAQPKEGLRDVRDFLGVQPNGDIIAQRTGILVNLGGACTLLQVNVHGGFTIDVSSDRLSAEAVIFPAGPGGTNPTVDTIRTHLEAMGIRCGNPVAIAQLLSAAATKRIACRAVVAQGTPAQRGHDGKVEFLVNLDFSYRPAIREDGRADYYSVHQFETVVMDQPLARIVPPDHGQAGVDVFGNRIAPQSGGIPGFRIGRGVRISPKDPLLVVANRDGHVYLRKDLLLVEEVLHINTDVDFRTGNIQFPGDVVIRGDVRAGFSVRANGSIRIFGAVEDATIIAGDNVVVGAGFVGTGKGTIRAGGDVVVGFVRNQTVSARGRIMIAAEAIDAHILAGECILAESLKSMVIGGELVARNLIRCRNLGGESARATRVRAGIDYNVLKRIDTIALKISQLQKDHQSKTAALELLDQEARTLGGLSPEKGLLRAQLRTGFEDFQNRIATAVAMKASLKKRVHNRDARVCIAGVVHPNVVIEIADCPFIPQEDLQRCFFYLQAGRVRQQAWTGSDRPDR